MRIRVEYFDQNERFAALLPVTGTVEREPRAKDSLLHWMLVLLDRPIEYDAVLYTHFLIASRWEGYQIAASAPVSVHILLVHSPSEAIDGFSYAQFPHVAWGMAHVIDT